MQYTHAYANRTDGGRERLWETEGESSLQLSIMWQQSAVPWLTTVGRLGLESRMHGGERASFHRGVKGWATTGMSRDLLALFLQTHNQLNELQLFFVPTITSVIKAYKVKRYVMRKNSRKSKSSINSSHCLCSLKPLVFAQCCTVLHIFSPDWLLYYIYIYILYYYSVIWHSYNINLRIICSPYGTSTTTALIWRVKV